ncbi:MAG: hypothetical protein ACRDYX_23410 [Egibacteraceae bacterium]
MRPDTGDIVSDLPSLVISWRRHLRAANLSPRTIASYTEGAQRYLDYAHRGRTSHDRRADPA